MDTDQSNEEKTEEPTDEQRLKFRRRGEIALSRDLSSVMVLGVMGIFLSIYFDRLVKDLCTTLSVFLNFDKLIANANFARTLSKFWSILLKIILPLFVVSSGAGVVATFLQTKFNLSGERIKPSIGRINPIQGLGRIVSLQSMFELGKSIAKFVLVFLALAAVFYSEFHSIPHLMRISTSSSWLYWASTSRNMLVVAGGFLLIIGATDYLYHYLKLEKKMMMTKQQVKEEHKNRELDPQIKSRLRKMQRDVAMSRTMEATKSATVIIANPTHYSVAIKYEYGMSAPTVVAKGKDMLALRMRELAEELDIPIVENKPLARLLYRTVKVGQHIPEELYEALSKIISYIIGLGKGPKGRGR